jgi:hypothetical protein
VKSQFESAGHIHVQQALDLTSGRPRPVQNSLNSLLEHSQFGEVNRDTGQRFRAYGRYRDDSTFANRGESLAHPLALEKANCDNYGVGTLAIRQ